MFTIVVCKPSAYYINIFISLTLTYFLKAESLFIFLKFQANNLLKSFFKGEINDKSHQVQSLIFKSFSALHAIR